MKRLQMFLISITALTITSLFSACGQSGALFIPGDAGTLATPQSEAPKNEEEDDNDDSPAANQ